MFHTLQQPPSKPSEMVMGAEARAITWELIHYGSFPDYIGF